MNPVVPVLECRALDRGCEVPQDPMSISYLEILAAVLEWPQLLVQIETIAVWDLIRMKIALRPDYPHPRQQRLQFWRLAPLLHFLHWHLLLPVRPLVLQRWPWEDFLLTSELPVYEKHIATASSNITYCLGFAIHGK